MKATLLCIFALLISLFFCSCESTRVYVKSQSAFYDNDTLVEQSGTVTRIDYKDKSATEVKKQKEVESFEKHYYDFSDSSVVIEEDDFETITHSFRIYREKTSKQKYETITFTLVEKTTLPDDDGRDEFVLGQRKIKYKNGKPSKPGKDVKFSPKDEELYQTVSKDFFESLNNKADTEETSISKKLKTESSTERITVESKTNGKYVAYTFLGKPFVIIGASAWNVIKCGGYAIINFMGGWTFAQGSDGPFWLMPSYSKSKAEADAAKEANRIKYYPEYHVPLTDNHITVDKFNREIEVEQLFSEGAEQISAAEHYEYDNTMSVSLSAKADAVSTAATAGLAGTVITIPVSGASWVFGAVAGFAENMR